MDGSAGVRLASEDDREEDDDDAPSCCCWYIELRRAGSDIPAKSAPLLSRARCSNVLPGGCGDVRSTKPPAIDPMKYEGGHCRKTGEGLPCGLNANLARRSIS